MIEFFCVNAKLTAIRNPGCWCSDGHLWNTCFLAIEAVIGNTQLAEMCLNM